MYHLLLHTHRLTAQQQPEKSSSMDAASFATEEYARDPGMKVRAIRQKIPQLLLVYLKGGLPAKTS
jgi:hypothetical protein